jgi:hypothetical protein
MLAIPFFSVTIAVVLALVLVGAALGGIYSAAVYCYAVTGKAPEGFDRFAIRDAFKRKGD